jgi:hypothetical protein
MAEMGGQRDEGKAVADGSTGWTAVLEREEHALALLRNAVTDGEAKVKGLEEARQRGEPPPPLEPKSRLDVYSVFQAIGQAVRPCRFSIAMLALGIAGFFVADQTPEALMTLCQRNEASAVAAFMAEVAQTSESGRQVVVLLVRGRAQQDRLDAFKDAPEPHPYGRVQVVVLGLASGAAVGFQLDEEDPAAVSREQGVVHLHGLVRREVRPDEVALERQLGDDLVLERDARELLDDMLQVDREEDVDAALKLVVR